MLSCQFVLTPPILLPVYWFILPSCFPSLPSSFAPFKISLCLQFRVGSYLMSDVVCVLSSLVQSSSALPASQPVCFFPYGVVFVCSFVLLIKAFFLQRLGLRLIHSLNPWQRLDVQKVLMLLIAENTFCHLWERRTTKCLALWWSCSVYLKYVLCSALVLFFGGQTFTQTVFTTWLKHTIKWNTEVCIIIYNNSTIRNFT